jgi:hypothetical protein
MPVCIAGMHRSGTSMVARALAACGLDLGAEDELMAATEHNERGHWEHEDFVALADELLARLGGGWDVPPALEEGWAERPELEDLRGRARDLASGFDGREPWGWKDPRSSLTLPFWRSVVPQLRVVVCLRHPVEVARSLTLRGASSQRFGLELWLAYAQRLLADTSPEERVVTHYGSYFHDGERELQQLCDALGLEGGRDRVRTAAETAVAGDLRHNRADEGATAELTEEMLLAYALLCAEAGPVFREALADEPFFPLPPDPSSQLLELARAQVPAKAAASAELRLRVRQEAKRVARLEERLAGIEGSRSYRLTAPIRRLRRRSGS